MSDDHCAFTMILKAPEHALDWLEQKFEGQFNEDDENWDYAPCDYRRDEDDPTEMAIMSDGETYWDECVDLLIEAICEMQATHSLTEPFSFTWAEFGPGVKAWSCYANAVVCYKGKAYRLSTKTWEKETAERLLKEDPVSGNELSDSVKPDEAERGRVAGVHTNAIEPNTEL